MNKDYHTLLPTACRLTVHIPITDTRHIITAFRCMPHRYSYKHKHCQKCNLMLLWLLSAVLLAHFPAANSTSVCNIWMALNSLLCAVKKLLIGPGIESRCGQLYLSHNHCDLQPWARAVCTLPAVPRSTQPSTLRRTVNEYQLSGWVIIINGDGGCRRQLPTGQADSQPKSGGLVWGSTAACAVRCIHQMNRVNSRNDL